jgi:hypothetical protein
VHWVYSPEWDASKGGTGDPKGVLMFAHDEHDLLVVVAVSLMTCGCQGGAGHRVEVNPTGAQESVTAWQRGVECLRRRGVIVI